MSNELAEIQRESMPAEIAERVLVHGDLSKLNANEKLSFYKSRCDAAGLDMRGRPFEFLSLQGKVVLYAKKECAEQLNGLHGLSHEIVSTESGGGLYEVRVKVTSRSGRTSEDIGVVVIDGIRGADLANARMKCVTKAKRRATLSFCGLGDVIDESELDTMGDRRACGPTGTPVAVANGTGFGRGQYASPEQTEAYAASMESYVDRRNQEWLDRWNVHGETPDGLKELCNRWQADNHLVKWARETGRIEVDAGTAERGVQNRLIGRYTAIVYHRSTEDRRELAQELARYIDEQAQRQTEALKLKNPALFGEPVSADDLEVDDGFEGVTDADSDVWPEGKE